MIMNGENLFYYVASSDSIWQSVCVSERIPLFSRTVPTAKSRRLKKDLQQLHCSTKHS